MKILTYNQYETYICKHLETVPLCESKGIPDVIKIFTNIIYNRLDQQEEEYLINIDKSFFDIELSIKFNKSDTF